MAMKLRVQYAPQEGYRPLIRRGKTGMEHLEFGILQMAPFQDFRGRTGEDEILLVILGGMIHLEAKGQRWEFLGRRKHVFEGKATSAYLPRGASFKLTSIGDSQIAFCKARSREDGEAYVISADEVKVSQRGEPGFEREIHDILPPERPATRLIVGETFNAPGQWSSSRPTSTTSSVPRSSPGWRRSISIGSILPKASDYRGSTARRAAGTKPWLSRITWWWASRPAIIPLPPHQATASIISGFWPENPANSFPMMTRIMPG